MLSKEARHNLDNLPVRSTYVELSKSGWFRRGDILAIAFDRQLKFGKRRLTAREFERRVAKPFRRARDLFVACGLALNPSDNNNGQLLYDPLAIEVLLDFIEYGPNIGFGCSINDISEVFSSLIAAELNYHNSLPMASVTNITSRMA
jgi:hypothetical protein